MGWKVTQTTMNGDRVVERTSDPERVRELEQATFDSSANIALTNVVEERPGR